jgi:hypothetical protein
MVVETASKLAISREADKLPALSGIAKKLQQKGAGTYLAGVWAESLAGSDLLWTVSAATRPKVWRAPSWSWVACEGGDVKFPSRKTLFSRGYEIEINDFSSVPAGADPTGEVAAGSITVTGLVTECLLGRVVKEHYHKWHERLVYKGQMICRVICDSGEDADNGPEGSTVYTLLMKKELRDPNSNDPTPFHALVLRGSQGFGGKSRVDDAFERIGIIQFARFWDPIRSTRMTGWEKWFEGADTKTVTIV